VGEIVTELSAAMADARRWVGGRYHPAFLTCLMLAVSVLMLLQYTYSGPHPAHNSILTKNHRNFDVATDSNITAAETSAFVEPEEDHALISQSLGEVETESLKAVDVPYSIVAPTGERDQSVGEFAGEEFVGEAEPASSSDVDGKQVEQVKLEDDVGGSDFANATGQVRVKRIPDYVDGFERKRVS
jgi:hypothetical protein